MPGVVLTGADDASATPAAGFFGKLPATGDFVARGLPDTFRRRWDGWITRHVAPLFRDGGGLPAGGLRFRLVSGNRIAAGLILPSHDSAGRAFPLSLLLIGDALPGPDAIDPWCDAASAAAQHALETGASPDALLDALDAIPAPSGAADGPPLLLWVAGQPAEAADPLDPSKALGRLLGR